MFDYFKRVFNSNGFDILVKENRLRSEYLSTENKSILKKLVGRLSASNLSAFDIQTSQKDFIGMALEAEQRDEALSSVIGNDLNSFCNEIIENGRKKDWKEAVILALPTALLCLTSIYGIMYILFNSCPAFMDITLFDFLFYVIWCVIGIPLANYSMGKRVFESMPKKTLSYLFFLAAFVLILFSDNIFHSKQVVLFQIVGWLPLAVMIVLSILAYILRNNYLRRLSEGYKWMDASSIQN